MARFKRHHLFVDPLVQGAIMLRCVFYWMTCVAMVFVMLFFWSLLTGPARISWMTVDDLWFQYGAVFVASFFLLPLVVWDSLRVSNRFAGPILRLRRELKKLAAGQHVDPLYFRRGDFWSDLADDFNKVSLRLKEVETVPPSTYRIAEQLELAGAEA